jgi:DNA-binding transcriptional regulator YdaS (Cro superfamily)
MHKKLAAWLADATAAQRARVAKAAGTSVNYLYQIGGGHRVTGAGLARSIELATGGDVLRTDLCPACSKCEYAKGRK